MFAVRVALLDSDRAGARGNAHSLRWNLFPHLFFHPKSITKVDPWCSENGSHISLRVESIQILLFVCCLESENIKHGRVTLSGS
jgi:hypothetical protein